MNLTQPVDHYCERIDPSYWSEPLNAITNIAFAVAALVLFRAWQRAQEKDGPALVLIVNLAAIGVGSYIFHTLATRGAALADTLPILTFILITLFFSARRYLKLPWWVCGLVTVLYLPVTPIIVFFSAPLIGSSAAYLPALFTILIFAGLTTRRDPEISRGLFLAAVILILSLTCRIADEPLCSLFPLGTHFLWHVLNAIVLFQLTRVLMRRRPSVG